MTEAILIYIFSHFSIYTFEVAIFRFQKKIKVVSMLILTYGLFMNEITFAEETGLLTWQAYPIN